MGSSKLTMRLTSFCHFWVLVLLGPIKAEDNFMFNSTRYADGSLWEMADNDNNIYNKIFTKLRSYAIKCCANINGLKGCETRQIAFWASVGKDVWDGLDNQEGALMRELELNYDPDKASTTEKNNLCKRANNLNLPYPNFAAIVKPKPKPGSNVGHTEEVLFRPIYNKARQLKKQEHFFLYTWNSPCGFPPYGVENCQKGIFDFTAYQFYQYDNTAGDWMPYHTMTVGLDKWYVGGSVDKDQARIDFCESVTSLKQSTDYVMNFSTGKGLSFKKIEEEGGDAQYAEEQSRIGRC